MAKKVPVENTSNQFSARLNQIIRLASDLNSGESKPISQLSDWASQLDEIVKITVDIEKEIPDCKPALLEAERLTEEILDVILSLATLDFTKTVRVGYEDTNFNAVAAGLNMLGQELQRSVVSKQYVDNIISSMTDALIVINPDKTLRTINDYACALLNYSPGEIIGRSLQILVEGEPDWLKPETSVLFKEGALHQANVTFKTKDDKNIPMQINASAMTDASGDITGVVIVARDMRETLRLIKAAEDAARAERKKSAELAETSRKLELVNSNLKVVNDSLENEVQSRKRAEVKLQHAHDSLEQQVSDRTQDLRKANQLLNLEIEERKRAEAEVSAREQKYRNIFETTSVSMWEQDFSRLVKRIAMLREQGIFEIENHIGANPQFIREALDSISIIDVNEATVKMFEAKNKQHMIENYREIFTEDTFKTLESVIFGIASGKLDFDLETTARTLKGHRINIVLQLRIPPGGTENEHASVSIVDLTSQRELEQQLRQSQKMEAIGRLAGGVAHDFNNLLTVILNYGQMVVEEVKPEDPIKKKIEAVVECAERAASLTQQLLAFSRRQMIEPKVLDLNSVLEKMQKMLQRLLGEDIELVARLNPSVGKVKADASQIEQVIMNLAVNARDAMPNGGKLIIETSNIEINDESPNEHFEGEPGSYVMFAVTDNGEGMTEEIRSKIFEPFFTTKGIGKGTGLGLSTVYGNIKQNGGHISVYSEVGHGTTFKVYLPQLLELKQQQSATEEQAVHLGARGIETVLVVEDEESVRGVACMLLKNQGYQIIEARNGNEAIAICDQHQGKIDILLTDVIMPNMNGRVLADTLSRNKPGLKVLYMSGYTDNAITQNGLLESGRAFLQKPFTPKTLLGKIREVLDTSSNAESR